MRLLISNAYYWLILIKNAVGNTKDLGIECDKLFRLSKAAVS